MHGGGHDAVGKIRLQREALRMSIEQKEHALQRELSFQCDGLQSNGSLFIPRAHHMTTAGAAIWLQALLLHIALKQGFDRWHGEPSHSRSLFKENLSP